MKTTALVVANRTATSPELLAALTERDDLRVELLVPPSHHGPMGRTEARRTLDAALAVYADAGIEATGRVGTDIDVCVAVVEAYDPAHHDEIVVSTLPQHVSRWLQFDGPARIRRTTGAIVRHVESRPPRIAPRVVSRVREPHSDGILSPLRVLGYGRVRS